jgi:bacterioferritin
MKGSAAVLAVLGELLANELTAINQYLLHGKTCENWGYSQLAEKLLEEAGGEREHADKLVQRILFLDGQPDLQRMHTVQGGSTVREILERDLAMEHAAIAALNDAIATCRAQGDNATEDLLVEILVAEQDDTHWIEAQLELMSQVGEALYAAQQLR